MQSSIELDDLSFIITLTSCAIIVDYIYLYNFASISHQNSLPPKSKIYLKRSVFKCVCLTIGLYHNQNHHQTWLVLNLVRAHEPSVATVNDCVQRQLLSPLLTNTATPIYP